MQLQLQLLGESEKTEFVQETRFGVAKILHSKIKNKITG